MKNSLVHTLSKPEKDIYIYALCEPNSKNIRYIGLATSGFKRIKRHFDGGGKWSSVKRWIKDLNVHISHVTKILSGKVSLKLNVTFERLPKVKIVIPNAEYC